MSRRSESSELAAIAAWDRLTLDQQHEAVREAAHHLARDRRRTFGANIVGFGFGLRSKASRLKRGCPTLVVIVERKLSKSQLQRMPKVREVPRHVIVRMKIASRRVEIAVPTDVVTKPPQPKAQSVTGLQMESLGDGLKIRGSVAAIVRDQQDIGERYFLTCHHVACLSLLDSDLQPHLPAEATLLPDRIPIGDTEREAFFGTNVGPCVDAALVRIDLDASGADLSLPVHAGGFVDSIAQLQSEAATGMLLFSLHKPDGHPVALQRVHVDFDVRYETGAVATMVEAMEYRVQGAKTRGGDSGGALISANGIFLGMHIAGAGSTGFGIPAYLLMESVAFDPPITLAEPL